MIRPFSTLQHALDDELHAFALVQIMSAREQTQTVRFTVDKQQRIQWAATHKHPAQQHLLY